MATFNSTQAAAKGSITAAPTGLNPTMYGGVLKCLRADFDNTVTLAAIAQNDLIKLFTLPIGWTPVRTTIYTAGTPGASVTMDVGTLASEALYVTAVDIAAAGTDEVVAPIGVINTPNTADVDVYAKLEGANPADGIDITVLMWCVSPQ